jgi:Tfp pilus assembly protein PilX
MRRPPSSLPRTARGAVLIVALLITALIAVALGSYLTLNLSTARLARQSYQQGTSFHLAEAGAEEAVWSFNQANAVVSREFSKKPGHGRWFGAKAKNHQRRKNHHDPTETEG